MDNAELIDLQLAEIELLEASYGSQFSVETSAELDSMRKSQTGSLGLARPRGLIMQLRLDLFSLWIQMPERYPETRLTVRFTSKQFDDEQVQRALDQEMDTINARSDEGELYICELIEWINDNVERFKTEQVKTKVKSRNDLKWCRYWIYSHHIYSAEKRRNMAQLSDEFDLRGFVLPGKPGIICVEGDSDDCHRFYSAIKRWNWQHLELKHEEKQPVTHVKELVELCMFDKVTELRFKVAGQRQNHQDLGEFRQYLEQRNCGHVYRILFNLGNTDT